MNKNHDSLYQPIKQTLFNLIKILKFEGELLDSKQISRLGEIYNEKTELAEKLESLRIILASDPQISINLGEENKKELWELNNLFETLAIENIAKIEKAILVNHGIIESFKRELIKQNEQTFYTKLGVSNNEAPALITGDVV